MRLFRPSKRRQRGSALIEVAASYAAITIVALVTLRSTFNNATGQRWTVKQAMTDAYLTRENALASRIPFEDITAVDSMWSVYPDVTTTSIVLGKLPGGIEVDATLHRTRVPDANNLPAAGGSGTTDTNPGETEAWKLQSIITYDVGGRSYVKSRTTLRIR